jgi:hypothetical protein
MPTPPDDGDRHTDRLLGETKLFAVAAGFVFLVFMAILALFWILLAIRLAG